MFFFPVEIFFHLNFNAYFFTSVSTSFYFRSFQPRFYEFIKFRFSTLTTNFVNFSAFKEFRDLMFPTTFFNPIRFTKQFYWFSMETSGLFLRTSWLNFLNYDQIRYKSSKSLTFHDFFKNKTNQFSPLQKLLGVYNYKSKIFYFDVNFFLVDFRKQNSFFFDFSFFHKFDTIFSSRISMSFFKKLKFTVPTFKFLYPNFSCLIRPKAIHSFYPFSINNKFFNSTRFFSSSFYKFIFSSSFRFRNVELDFVKIPKHYRFMSEFRGFYRGDWPFERARRNRFFIPNGPLFRSKYKKSKLYKKVFILQNLFIKKFPSNLFYKKKMKLFSNARNSRFFFYSNAVFALSNFHFFKRLLLF
jgi:hypothetical protein